MGQDKKIGDWSFPKESKVILGSFACAFLLRALYLLYLHQLNWPDKWFQTDQTSFMVSMHFLGLPISSELEHQFGSLISAFQEYRINDPGLTYVFYLAGKLTGYPSFAAVQWMQVGLDAFMVFPIARIGKLLAGDRCAKWAAWSYALFLPQIYINSMPHYSTWLTYGYILSTLLFISSDRRAVVGKWAFFSSACGVIFLTSFLRSTIAFFGIAFVLLMAAGNLVFTRKVAWSISALGLLVACIFVVARSKVDLSGQGTPVRSTLAHSLMVGVGQFNNPYGLKGEDGYPLFWYMRENPDAVKRLEQYSSQTNSPEYNAWLMERFKEFLVQHPFTYAQMVLKRGLMIFFPNFKISPYADSGQYALLFRDRNKEIMELSGRLYSLGTGLVEKVKILTRIAELETSYVVLLPYRLLFMFMMPFGIACAFWFTTDRLSLVAPLSPLLYTLGTVSFVFGPGHLHISAWAASIPVVAFGWLCLWRHLGELYGAKAKSA